jgi:hypothetical protein
MTKSFVSWSNETPFLSPSARATTSISWPALNNVIKVSEDRGFLAKSGVERISVVAARFAYSLEHIEHVPENSNRISSMLFGLLAA